MGMSSAEKQAAYQERYRENKQRIVELESEVARLKASGGGLVKASRGLLTRQQHRLIKSLLHPDRVTDPVQKERHAEAFRAFNECFPDRDELRDIPKEQQVPRDAEAWGKRRKRRRPDLRM